MKDVSAVYLWQNGMVMTFGNDGQQIAELQGPYSDILHAKIKDRSDDETEWHGFYGERMKWRSEAVRS